MGYELIKVTDLEDWQVYHNIRRTVLFEAEGLFNVYKENAPGNFLPENHPLLLKNNGIATATARLDFIKDNKAIIRLVAVEASEQRQGHGRILGAMVEDYAQMKGVDELYVNASLSAVGYYQKMGWQEYIWNQAEIDNHSMGEVIQMKKKLK